VSNLKHLHGKEFWSPRVSDGTVHLVREAFERGSVSPPVGVAVNYLSLAYSLEAFLYESLQTEDD
jgi:hypothetical protein